MNDRHEKYGAAAERIGQMMTLDEKIGQLFTFYNLDPSYSEFAETAIAEWKVGGMFLDMDSLCEPEQVHRLTSRMQEAALSRGSGVPLFISADFVAGAGCKLSRGGAVHFPKNRAIGQAGDEKLAYESGRVTALESLAMGVNFNYSPVVDVNNNPLNPVIGTHSFGEEPALVGRLGAAVIRGYQDHGMIATAKHFPGHGDTHVDSHHDLPVLAFDRDRLDRFELAPFRDAIAAGVDAVMVGHIAVPSLDPSGLPASLSHAMITGLLRGELGFGGLIVTDGLSMKGVTSRFSQAEACVLALKAGADQLLAFARTAEEGREMVERVRRAVRDGELEEARIEQSLARVLALKARYGLTPDRFAVLPFDGGALNRPEHEAISLELARKAALPVNGLETAAGVPGSAGKRKLTLVRDRKLELFAASLAEAGWPAEERLLDGFADLEGALAELDAAAGADDEAYVIALAHNKPMPPEPLAALRNFASARRGKIVWVHFGSPYDAEHAPDLPALLMSDHAPALQRAAAEWLAARGGRENE
ncbi:glycoside hydrolase family 3 protein [Paenibacillus thermoaerophilus]|uniref:beta-N-acetylhexosaminidase n=1 Tax=Paenibacillus thermoaerophilus TaxID=1215385 RepID=A0ABW2V030_9BACL|nr:glycoside hydrolase family 3 N-terminal domain-containing protein [Paenibacillus thermoaerophilus]TMV17780.1 glycoside hydrolase [Paenibacillus thermoaerophilus]